MTHGKQRTYEERFGPSRSQTKPVRAIIPAQEWIHYHKAPEHAMIFTCDTCGTPRVYGRAFMIPDNVNPLLICHNCIMENIYAPRINMHTPHSFKGIFIGGGVRVPEMLSIQ